MPDILEVTPDDINRLSDLQLHQLVEQLLEAEKRNVQIGAEEPRIIVSHEVRAPDGGIDGEFIVHLDQNADFPDGIPAETRPYIPSPHVMYQCKATEMGPKACADELLKGNTIKEAVLQRIEGKAAAEVAYVIACTQKVGNLDAINAREKACQDAFTQHEIAPPVIRFLDAEMLARWSNRHIATRSVAVRYAGRELTGSLLPLEQWADYPEVKDFPFCINPELTQLIHKIRMVLAGQTKLIRITGNSGLGKTRLTYEVFHVTLDNDTDLNQFAKGRKNAVVYIDLESSTSVPRELDAIREACTRGDRGIVVIDNCPIKRHEEFARWFLDAKCNLKLITVDYFEDEGSSRGEPFLLRAKDLTSIIPDILRKSSVAASLTENAITAISQFAQGYPRVAVLAAELGRAPTPGDRNYEDYVERLLWGRKPPEEQKRHKEYIRALSSVAVFGFSGRVEDQYAHLLSALLKKPPGECSKEMNYFMRRRILEPLGDYMVVSPAPIAVALFSQWLEETPPEEIFAFANGLSDFGLLDQFCRQLRRLGMNAQAGEIAARICSGPFASAENLTSGTGSSMLRSLAELNPPIVAACLKRAISIKTVDEVLKIEGPTRRNIVTTLVRLAVEHSTFADAARLLVLFAAAENEKWDNNATGSLNQLFHLYLSGTRVPASERLDVIREFLSSRDQLFRRIALKTIGAGLLFGHYMRMGTPSIGGHLDAEWDWRPRNNREQLDYWKGCYSILRTVIMENGAESEEARRVLGENISAILQTPLIEELDEDFKALAAHLGNLWPAVKDQIKTLLDLHDDLPQAQRTALERWKTYLTPPTELLSERLRDTVSLPGWHHRRDEKGTYVDTSEEGARQLAFELVDKKVDLLPFLPVLLVGEQQQGFSFGSAIAKLYPNLDGLVNEALRLWPSLDPEKRNASLLCGIISTFEPAAERTILLDRAAADRILSSLLVRLTSCLFPMTPDDFLRIRIAVEDGRIDLWDLRGLIQGQPLRMLPDSFVLTQFQELLHWKTEMAQVLFEVLWLHCHGAPPEKFDFFAPLFQELLLQKGLPVLNSHFGWEWHEAAKKLIAISQDKQWLKEVAEYIRNAIASDWRSGADDFLGEVAAALFEKIPLESWQVFLQPLQQDDEPTKYRLSRFLGKTGSSFHETHAILWALPPAEFRELIRGARAIIPRLLDSFSLFQIEQMEDGSERYVWHANALILIEEAEDETAVEHALVSNLLSFGSTGSRVPYLQKRLALLENLKVNGNEREVRISTAIMDVIGQEIDRTRLQEQNEAARFLYP